MPGISASEVGTSYTDRFGWYGLGSMGLGMALNLQKALESNGLGPLRYSNRTLDKGKPLQKAGGLPLADFIAVVKECNVIFTMISNDQVLKTLVDATKTVDNLEGKIFVDTSTVHPDTSAHAAKQLSGRGALFVASPVFGASTMAAAGKLIFAMAGPAAAITKIRPFVQDVMGRSIIDCGEDVSRSSLLKITGNIMVIGMQELIAEVHVFAEKTGLGTGTAHEFIASMYGATAEGYSKRLTSGSFAPPHGVSPGFGVSLSIKDSKHALSIANGLDMRLPAIELALGHMLNARHYAGEALDSSSLYGTLRTEAGLPFFTAESRQSP